MSGEADKPDLDAMRDAVAKLAKKRKGAAAPVVEPEVAVEAAAKPVRVEADPEKLSDAIRRAEAVLFASNEAIDAKTLAEAFTTPLKGLKVLNETDPIGAPASKAFFNEVKGNPGVAATLASAQDGAPMPNNPEMGRFWSSMASAMANVSEGRQTPKEAMDAAAKRITAK